MERPQAAFKYASETLKWENVPQSLIDDILKDPLVSFQYAYVLRDNERDIPEVVIDSFLRRPAYAYLYAMEILKWNNVPQKVIDSFTKDPEYAEAYARGVLKWEKVPQEIIDVIKSNKYFERGIPPELI